MPLSTVHSNSLLYFLLSCETHDLVWEIISVSEKRMKNCIVKIIDNVFEKNDEGGLFPLTDAHFLISHLIFSDILRGDEAMHHQAEPRDRI